MEAEQALESLGNPWRSRSTVPAYLIICVLRSVVSAWQYTAIVFLGADTDHECRLPDATGSPSSNGSSLIQSSVDGVSALGQCHLYNSTDNSTVYCTEGWLYHGERHTIVDEWDLVCDKDYMSDFSQMMYNLGTMIGSLFMGFMTDRLGRKWVFLANASAMAVFTLLAAVVPSFYAFVVLRFITGIFHQGANVSGMVLACELFPTKSRGMAGTLIHCFWGMSMGVMALIALQVTDWRYLMMFMTLPSLLIIPACWLIQESIPWLMATNRREEARKVLRKLAKWNRVELSEAILNVTPPSEQTQITDSRDDVEEKKTAVPLPVITVQDKPVISGQLVNKRLFSLKLEEKLLNIINISGSTKEIGNLPKITDRQEEERKEQDKIQQPYFPNNSETAETPSLAIRHHRLQELSQQQSADDPGSRLLFSSAPELRDSSLLPSPKSVAKLNKLSLMVKHPAASAKPLHHGLTPTGSGNIDEWQAMFQSRLHLERSVSQLNMSVAEAGEDDSQKDQSGPKELEKQGLMDMVRSKIIRRTMILLSFAFVSISISYFGLSLSSGNLAGNIYVNYALTGLSEVPANLLLGLVINRF